MHYESHGDVALLGFDDGKANAVGHDFMDAMNEGLDRAQREAKAVVVMGMAGKFSAGFDLKELAKGPAAVAAILDGGARMLLRLFTHPQPVVAGCTGHAIAAGALTLLACDTRIGAHGDYRVGLNETAISMNLPVFGLELASARLSKRHLTAAVVQARLYNPEEAVDAGFLDEVVVLGELRDACLQRASALAELPGPTYAHNKVAIRQAFIERIQQSLND